MGCGTSTVFQFSIHILEIKPTNTRGQCILKQTYKEVFTMQEKITIIQYMFNSTHEEFSKFFKNHNLLKKALYVLVFDDQTSCIAEYPDAYSFIPKDEYSYYRKGNSPMILAKVFVMETTTFSSFKLTNKSFCKQVEKMKDLRDQHITIGNLDIVDDEEQNDSDKDKVGNPNNITKKHTNNTIKEVEEELNETQIMPESEYDSDSSNTVDAAESFNTRLITFKGNLTTTNVNEIENCIEQEKNKKEALLGVSINCIKFREADMTITENLIKRISSEVQVKKDSLLTIKSKNSGFVSPISKNSNSNISNEPLYRPQYLTDFEFHDNGVETDIQNRLWYLIFSFLRSKRTLKSKKLNKADKDLRKYKVLRNLDLSMNSIDDEVLIKIIRGIKNVRLHNLNLSGNFITSHGLSKLTNWLKKNKSLIELSLQNNTVTDVDSRDGFVLMLAALKDHRKIRILNCSYLNSESLMAQYCNLFMTSNKCRLKTLKLKDAHLSFEDFEKLGNALSSINCTLVELDISENNREESKASSISKILINIISGTSSLEMLNIGINKLDDSMGLSNQLATANFNRSNLSTLELGQNDFNYFDLLTNLIGKVSDLKSIKREVHIHAGKENQVLTPEEENLVLEFKKHNTNINLSF